MMNLISTKKHGILDYLSVAGLLFTPRFLNWSTSVRQLLTGAAVATLSYSLLTRYELGLAKVLPMKIHLTLDGLSGALFCSMPMVLAEEDKGVLSTLFGFGVFEIVVVLLSRSESTN